MNKLVTLFSFVFLPPYVFDSVTKAVLGKSEIVILGFCGPCNCTTTSIPISRATIWGGDL